MENYSAGVWFVLQQICNQKTQDILLCCNNIPRDIRFGSVHLFIPTPTCDLSFTGPFVISERNIQMCPLLKAVSCACLEVPCINIYIYTYIYKYVHIYLKTRCVPEQSYSFYGNRNREYRLMPLQTSSPTVICQAGA